MRLGIALPLNFDDVPDRDVISRGARDAEEHGFDSVWFFDSIGRGRFSLDPLIAAAVAAAATERVEVGIGVLQAPLRHPVELAHRVLTSQLLCEGRLLLGVGAGSTRIDFQAVDKDFNDRMQLLTRSLAVMRRLWNGRTVNDISLNPAPAVAGGPPLLIGSWAGPRWISAAAEEYDGWIASAFFSGFDTLKAGIDRYREADGMRAIVTNISTDLDAPTEPLADSDNAFHLRCAPDAAAERLRKLAAAGFDDAVLVHRGAGPPNLSAIRGLLA